MANSSSVSDHLTIELEVVSPTTWRAARELERAWEEGGGRKASVRVGSKLRPGPRVAIGLGSLINPNVVVAFEQPYRGKAAKEAVRLALSSAGWDSLRGFDAWRALSAPITYKPWIGRRDGVRRWAAAWGGDQTRFAELQADEQIHVVGGATPPPTGTVWWSGRPAVAALVLGRAVAVLGSGGPMVWDAIRAGVPVRGLEADALEDLAGLVPRTLIGDKSLWRAVVETVREVRATGRAPAPLMTPEWVMLGRERARVVQARPPSRIERAQRRMDKFVRDPRGFLRDSRFAALRRLAHKR